jgi:putative oxidoreductase
MNIRKTLQLDFLPRSVDAGLLVLRLWLGLSLLVLHGWGKLTTFSETASKFPDPIGVGSSASLALAVFAEVGCALLIAVGLLTRAAALVQVILMSVAFFVVHQASLAPGPGSGELAFIYLAGFLTLLLTGPGVYSLDAKLGAAAPQGSR